MAQNYAVIAVDAEGRTFDIGPVCDSVDEAHGRLAEMRERMGHFAKPYVVAKLGKDGAFRPVTA